VCAELFVFLYFLLELHPEDNRNAAWNMLVRILWIKYIINTEVRFVGYLYILDQISPRKIEHIKIQKY
jgi:hypothetical protein